MAVCEYCRSTLIRRDADIENIGKMAELLEDASLIQIGSEGQYRGVHFAVIGRIQLQYPQGIWNEWHLLFDNQRSGWLSDAGGDYTVTFLTKVQEPLPALADMQAGKEVMLNGEPYTVTDIERGRCIAGAGELLFKVGAGFEAPSVDLRCARNFASIDYSEAIPLTFLGASADFKDLHLSNLRDPAQVGVGKTKLNALQCPACAAPVEIHAAGIVRLTCPSCHSLLSSENENLRLLQKFSDKKKVAPLIPLGSEGKLDGVNYRVLGFLQRVGKSDGVMFGWEEYLLYHPEQGFRWLTEYDGHWNFASPCNAAPTRSFTRDGTRALVCNGRMYRHFEESRAKIGYVAGEFYWRVSVDEEAVINDYIDPPCVLSEEKSNNEITWTEGEYIEPEVVQQAFAIERPMPAQFGVCPNQPWPHEESYRKVWRSFWYATLLALAVQLVSVWLSDNRVVFQTTLDLPVGKSEAVTTPEFEVVGHSGNLHFINHTNLNNNWVYLSMELVARDTGQVYAVNRELSYYSGYDDGYWSEGSASDDATIANVPPGHYLLSVEAEADQAQAAVTAQLEIRRNVSNWHNFLIIELSLLLFPMIYWWRRATFEAERWSGSEHPQYSPGEKIMSVLKSGSDDN